MTPRTERHLVLDLETLSTKVNASILSIGAIVFDPNKTDVIDYVSGKSQESPDITTYYNKISLESCDALQMDIDEDTVKWWSRQNPTAIEEAFSDGNRTPIKDAILELNKFSKSCKRFWAKSPDFDCKIIEYAAHKLGIGVPWQYYDTRCIRTIEDHIDFKSSKTNSHHASEDCFYEAAAVQMFYAKMRTK